MSQDFRYSAHDKRVPEFWDLPLSRSQWRPFFLGPSMSKKRFKMLLMFHHASSEVKPWTKLCVYDKNILCTSKNRIAKLVIVWVLWHYTFPVGSPHIFFRITPSLRNSGCYLRYGPNPVLVHWLEDLTFGHQRFGGWHFFHNGQKTVGLKKVDHVRGIKQKEHVYSYIYTVHLIIRWSWFLHLFASCFLFGWYLYFF